MKKNFKYIIALLILSLVFTGCNNQDAAKTEEKEEVAVEESVETKEEKPEDVEVYEGVGKGRNGEIKVAVSLDKDKKIADIELLEHEETDGYWEKALEGIEGKIVEDQTLAVEAVSGATLSSNGILVGTAEALKAAEVDVDALGYVAPKLPDPSEQIVQTGSDKVGVKNFEYTTQGNTCSTKVTFTVNEEDMTVHDLVIYDGCDGNARGFSALADGSNIDDIIERFEGISCHASEGSSCPDQIAKALNEARFIMQGERLVVKK